MPKVIIVTGGSDGLGKEIAIQLISSDHKVVILAHNPAKLAKIAQEIGVDFVSADVSNFTEVTSAIDQVVKKYGRIDVLVNCAGIWAQGPITDNSPEEIDELINVNTKGTIFLSKAVIPVMETQGGGDIVNIISQDGLMAKKDRSLYHATKWAITGFTKCLQQDLSEKKIRVTGIYPGLMKTGLFEKKGVDRNLSHALELSEVAKLVGFVINLNPDTLIPEIGIKHLLNTDNPMDDSNSGMDINLDPNMMTTQGQSPQVVPLNPDQSSTPQTPTPGVVDITPGSTPASPYTPSQTPPSSEPALPVTEPASPFSAPPVAETPVPTVQEPVLPPLETPPATQTPSPLDEMPNPLVTGEPTPPSTPMSTPPTVESPTMTITPPAAPAEEAKPTGVFTVDQSSPLFENPDSVKPAK